MIKLEPRRQESRRRFLEWPDTVFLVLALRWCGGLGRWARSGGLAGFFRFGRMADAEGEREVSLEELRR